MPICYFFKYQYFSKNVVSENGHSVHFRTQKRTLILIFLYLYVLSWTEKVDLTGRL